ncbi:replication-associated protein [Stipagrostis associaed virus]|uniref:replication-associated protein n=1 Tax=Stipagrostis associaed virus TaxID=2282646 RepID=UPI000DF5E3A1|nr:replication-associated protein [Stipagrostis associaed virus]AXF50874.1 replication-associated protein [Stipagrostis associaed virus]
MYRIRGQALLLTYSQTSLDQNDLAAFHHEQLPISYYLLANETHQDNGRHYHVYLETEKRFDITNVRRFDFGGEHPNTQVPRNREATINYCKKEGDYWELGRPATNASRQQHLCEETTFSTGDCRNFEKEIDWIDHCITNKIQFGYCARIWALHNIKPLKYITNDSIFNGVVTHPTLMLPIQPDPAKATVVIGPTGVGKTVWAKRNSIKPALLIRHLEDLKTVDWSYLKTIIFDDMLFRHWPLQTQIHLLDWDEDSSIHARYGNITIPANTHKIFTCNEDPFIDHEAIFRRIHVYRLSVTD